LNGTRYSLAAAKVAIRRRGRPATFSELFDWIEEEKVKNPFISEYTFDQKYGFPNMIYFNLREDIKDEELRYVFTDFKIID